MMSRYLDYPYFAGRGSGVPIMRMAAPISLAIALLFTARVSAREGEEAVVMMVDRREEASVETVIRAVEAQISDLSVTLHVQRVGELPADLPSQIAVAEDLAGEYDALAVFWCDFDRPDRIYLFFAAPSGGRVLVRELAGSGTGGLAEALAIIVRNSIEAVLAGGVIGEIVPPHVTPASENEEETPSPMATESSGRRLLLSIAYRLDMMSDDELLTHSAAMAFAVKLTDAFAIGAGYAVASPLEAETHGVLLRIERHPVWIACRGIWGMGRIDIETFLNVQADFTTENIRAFVPRMNVSKGELEIRPSLVPGLRVGVWIVSGVALFLAAGADIALFRTRYLVETATGAEEIFSTWPVGFQAVFGVETAPW